MVEGLDVAQYVSAALENSSMDGVGLPIKKWGLEDQEDCADIVCLGGVLANAYDSLLHAQPATETPVYRFIVVSYSLALIVLVK